MNHEPGPLSQALGWVALITGSVVIYVAGEAVLAVARIPDRAQQRRARLTRRPVPAEVAHGYWTEKR